MRCERRGDGGLTLELDAKEAVLFRHLVERASFQDTPPEVQDAILRMADVILKTLGSEGV